MSKVSRPFLWTSVNHFRKLAVMMANEPVWSIADPCPDCRGKYGDQSNGLGQRLRSRIWHFFCVMFGRKCGWSVWKLLRSIQSGNTGSGGLRWSFAWQYTGCQALDHSLVFVFCYNNLKCGNGSLLMFFSFRSFFCFVMTENNVCVTEKGSMTQIDLIFFGHFQKKFGHWPKKNRFSVNCTVPRCWSISARSFSFAAQRSLNRNLVDVSAFCEVVDNHVVVQITSLHLIIWL